MEQIIWIEPYALDRKIGVEYNRIISYLPDHCWIGITDHDMCFLHPEQKKWIAEIVGNGGYELYGCMTNRLYGTWQAPFRGCNGLPNMYDEQNYLRHKEFAMEIREQYGNEVEHTEEVIAGLLMVFNKDTWERVGRFNEKVIGFDSCFSKVVPSKGIMRGIYVFHDYRMPLQAEEACRYNKHLYRDLWKELDLKVISEYHNKDENNGNKNA